MLPLTSQMRRTVSLPASPALLRVRIPGVRKADQNGIGERKSVPQMRGVEAAAGAAVGPSYKGEARGKTRPDSSRRPTGHSLIPEKNVAEERRRSSARPFSLSSLYPARNLSFPVYFLPALLPTIIPYQWNGGGGRFSLKLI